MAVVSYLQLILVLLSILCSDFGHVDGHINRHRRQLAAGIDRNTGAQQQPNKNPSGSSQGQSSAVQSRGFYNSPEFKSPLLSGEKPVGWFDTKYPNWLSNQENELDANGKTEAKNGAPSSLHANGILPIRQDGGAFFLQKLAKQYAGRGEKGYNFAGSKERAGVCTNYDNYNGYIFGKFPCPLPIGTGMNQLDRFCCGPVNSQYCCNAQEHNYNQRPVHTSGHHHSKHGQYSPSSNRAVAIVVPIVGTLVIAGALIIIFLYYKRLRQEQGKSSKSPGTVRLHDTYAAVPRDPPSDRPIVTQQEPSNANV